MVGLALNPVLSVRGRCLVILFSILLVAEELGVHLQSKRKEIKVRTWPLWNIEGRVGGGGIFDACAPDGSHLEMFAPSCHQVSGQLFVCEHELVNDSAFTHPHSVLSNLPIPPANLSSPPLHPITTTPQYKHTARPPLSAARAHQKHIQHHVHKKEGGHNHFGLLRLMAHGIVYVSTAPRKLLICRRRQAMLDTVRLQY